MTKYKLEYIWLDGYTPTPSLRGKTQIKEFDKFPTLEQLPLWGFDGSSTMQAEGHSSDCVLKPAAVYPDAARENGRRNLDGALPDAASPRIIRHRHRIPLQAARRHRLERLRHARQLLDQVYARSRRQGILREADGCL